MLKLEPTRCAWGQADATELAKLEVVLVRLSELLPHSERWDQEVRTADTWLHGLIAESCGSARLTVEIGRYLKLFRPLPDIYHTRDAGPNYARSNDTPEHRALVRPTSAGDADWAAQVMDRHIRAVARNLVEVIFGERVRLQGQ